MGGEKNAETPCSRPVCHCAQFQHVNNVHYVRFLESNRMFFAEKLAGKLAPARQRDIMRGSGQSFILQGISVRYRRPVVWVAEDGRE